MSTISDTLPQLQNDGDVFHLAGDSSFSIVHGELCVGVLNGSQESIVCNADKVFYDLQTGQQRDCSECSVEARVD